MKTPQEAADYLRSMAGLDQEWSHAEADDMFCEILRELGYGEAVEIFSDMTKWYS